MPVPETRRPVVLLAAPTMDRIAIALPACYAFLLDFLP